MSEQTTPFPPAAPSAEASVTVEPASPGLARQLAELGTQVTELRAAVAAQAETISGARQAAETAAAEAATASAPTVPAGGGAAVVVDPSSLTPEGKIAVAVSRRRR